jgi:hypothetical protein
MPAEVADSEAARANAKADAANVIRIWFALHVNRGGSIDRTASFLWITHLVIPA